MNLVSGYTPLNGKMQNENVHEGQTEAFMVMGLHEIFKMHSVEQMKELAKHQSKLMSNTINLKRTL